MKQNVAQGSDIKIFGWIDLVLYLSDMQYLSYKKITDFLDKFASVTVAAPVEKPQNLPLNVDWYGYDHDDNRSAVWNWLLKESGKDWVLFLEDDEAIRFSDFPEMKCIAPDQWPPALIRHTESENTKQYYQIRLVHKSSGIPFEGKNLPDCTSYITSSNITLSKQPIIIERQSDLIEHIDTDEELSIQAYSPKLYLIKGERLLMKGKVAHAAALYRKLLKADRLLPFDRLAAVNGLASCLTEQYKWPQALILAQRSIKAEPLQQIPYLIQYKIYQLNKEWGKAFAALKRYHELINLWSKASFDKAIGEEETLLNLAELAMKAGYREKVSAYMEQLFDLKRGDIDHDLLQRLLVMSIELSNYEKAVYYFEHMFGDVESEQLDGDQTPALDDYMTLFMKKGWYEFASKIYEELYYSQPDNQDYKRRLIVALSKTDNVEKARKLVRT